jgi:L-threonylcarbamoyladenylate synthase
MRTQRLKADPASIAKAAEILRSGGLVAFPTETVYGLGARADDAAAVRRIFEAKKRPPGNPLIVHVASAEAASRLALFWPEEAARLAAAFWPGPLTLVALCPPGRLPREVTAGRLTVGIRVPEHPVARALLEASGVPVAAPSANRSTSISPTTAGHVLKTLRGKVDLILDGGPTGHGIESTIVDTTASPVVVLRLGAIPLSAIQAVVPAVCRADAVVDPSSTAPAPGMHARHYAPRAKVLLVPRAALRAEVLALRGRGETAGILDIDAPLADGEALESLGGPLETLPADPAGYASGLYAALHRLEDAHCGWIVIAAVPEDPAWAAVRDRLRRASAPAINSSSRRRRA